MKDKFVVVTGASTGIGKAIAIAFAKGGAFVLLMARSEAKLNEVKKEIEKLGGKAEIFVTDLSSPEDIEKSVKEIEAKCSEINIICNIAGIWHGTDEVYANKDYKDFERVTIVDTVVVGTLAPMLLVHGLASLMPNGSSIINLSGTFENGGKGWLPYYVSKRAIEDLTIGLSQELADKGIRVNCVSPSDTATEEYKKFFPDDAKDAQTPEEVAKLFIELVQKDVTGKIFVIKKGKVEEGFHK